VETKPTPSIRWRMSLIVSAGLILLIVTTFVISLMVSAAVNQDDERLALLAASPSETNVQRILTGEQDDAIIALLNRALTTHDETAINQAVNLIRLRRADNVGMVRGMYAALFISSLMFLLIGLWFTQQIIVAPVEELDRIANRIASGDLDTPVVLEGQGEFRDLTSTFESMRLKLRYSYEQLTRWTRDLEARVAQRTQELTALSQVIAAASRSLESDAVLRTALEQSLQVVGVESGGSKTKRRINSNLPLGVVCRMRCVIKCACWNWAKVQPVARRRRRKRLWWKMSLNRPKWSKILRFKKAFAVSSPYRFEFTAA